VVGTARPPPQPVFLEDRNMNAPRAWLLSLAALLAVPAAAPAQEEVGAKKRKIAIDWGKLDTKNYAIEYEKVIPISTVRQVGDELERILAQYILVFRYKPAEKLKVKFLDSPNTYEQEGGKPSAAGHFSPGTGYLYLKQAPFHNLVETTYHEACHQYLQFFIGKGAEVPMWFTEGMAEYFEGIQANSGDKKLDHRRVDNRKLRMIQEKIATRSTIPLEKLIGASDSEFYSKDDPHKEGLNYAQSFSLIYFFMQGMGGKPVFQYANELKKSPAAANEKIFGKDLKNLKSIEAKWKAYVAQVKIAEKPGL
jgi:hypothetical protein